MPLTARATDPLSDLRQIAETCDVELAIDLWLRARSQRTEILNAADRFDLRDDAHALARMIEANPIFESRRGYKVRDQVLDLLAAVRLTAPSWAERRPSRLMRRRQPA